MIHLPGHKWIIVDSCIDHEKGIPVALRYLRQIGVDPSRSVSHILATHWHDDHVAGIAQTLVECSKAQFVCSVAQQCEEFLAFVYAHDDARMMGRLSSGVSEFRDILEKANDRIVWTIENRSILHYCVGGQNVDIRSLSPSDMTITNAKFDMASRLHELTGTQRRAVAGNANHFTTVVYISVDQTGILLGGDQLVTRNKGDGWNRIVSLCDTDSRIHKAAVYKVAHHGSQSADTKAIWDVLLLGNPIALIAPWSLGKAVLPQEADIARISKRTNKAYLTAPSERPKAEKRSAAVERSLKEAGYKIWAAEKKMGQVQVRWEKDAKPEEVKVRVVSPAYRI